MLRKRRLWILLLAGFLLIGGGLLWWQVASPLSSAQAQNLLSQKIQALQQKSPQLAQAQMLVSSPSFTAHVGADAEQPFHVASMGKLFTTVLIAQLVEQGKLSWDSKITELLPPDVLEGLFVVDGVDHKGEVRLEQLLMHTSGIADYFADPVKGAKPVMEQVVVEPNKTWTPRALLDLTRQGQQALFAPGKGYHYSDSGFILLGLIIEAQYKQSFETVVHERIFQPLGMQHSYFPFRTQPSQPTAQLSPVWVNGTDLSQSAALTADWAGGGAASTTADLLKFAQALMGERLIRRATLEYLSGPLNRFEQGIHYGRGMMRLKFGEFFPLLASYPDMIGHMGILGTQLFFDAQRQTVVIVSLGTTGHMEDSVRLLIEALGLMQRIK